MATKKEAMEQSIKYFNGDELAADVFLSKYALTTPDGDILEPTPDFMHKRLAKEFSRIEAKYPNPMSEDEIYEMFKGFKKVAPQGSPMSGIGNPYVITSLSNCFVVTPPKDSYAGIMYTDQQIAQIEKRRGGVGTDISNIRPKGEKTLNAAKTTDGIGVFMERFSRTTREVAQGGRRGALILTIDVRHPEILTFINIKKDLTKVTGANISIRLCDEFMHAVKKDENFQLQWPVESKNPSVTKIVRARDIWDELINAAWQSAEPGLLFWDTLLRNSPSDCYWDSGFRTVSCNPCSELGLSPDDSCRLMVLNLLGFVHHPFTAKAYFDYDEFIKYANKAQRLMDDLVDLELEAVDKIIAKIKSDPEPQHIKQIELDLWLNVRKACVNGRRTGLGITALGDCLAQLGIRYGSKESIETTEAIYKTLAVGSYSASVEMAEERGAFPVYDYSKEADHAFISRVIAACPKAIQAKYKKFGRRNLANLTTAPVGSLSTETQTTSGIEPAFLLEYTRRKKINADNADARVDFIDKSGDKWQEFKVYHHEFKHWMDITGKTDVKYSPYYKATSADVDWVAGVDLQAAAQRWICHSISKTINLPNSATKELVSDVYMRGWEAGCKGLTVYRDGCRTGVLVSNESAKAEAKESQTTDAPKRPTSLPCDIYHTKVKGEEFTILVGLLDSKPYEVFGGHPLKDLPKHFEKGTIQKIPHGKTKPATYNLIVKNGSEETIEDINSALDNPLWGAFTRLLSTSLRHGVKVSFICEQLHKGEKDPDMRAFSKVMARVLKHYIENGSKSHGDKICSACGADGLIYQEGCLTCSACSASKCS